MKIVKIMMIIEDQVEDHASFNGDTGAHKRLRNHHEGGAVDVDDGVEVAKGDVVVVLGMVARNARIVDEHAYVFLGA